MMATHAQTSKLSPTERLAIYGGIAAAMREGMARKKLTPAELNEALGRDRSHAGVYHYRAGKLAPDDKSRPKLARILGVPESALRKATLEDGQQARPEPATALARLPAPPAGRLPDVLTFAIAPDGTARLRLDYSASAERGVALLRLLLDFGFAIAAGGAPSG
jgi:transcriptional regulator with XRE-family HTH domain